MSVAEVGLTQAILDLAKEIEELKTKLRILRHEYEILAKLVERLRPPR